MNGLSELVIRVFSLFIVGAIIGLALNPDAVRRWRDASRDELVGGAPLVPVEPAQAWADLRAGKIWLLDVRDGLDYAEGHIPGSIATIDPNYRDLMPQVRRLLTRRSRIIVVDGGIADFRSKRRVSSLRFLGFGDIAVLKGGIEAWKAEQLPLVSGWDDMEPLLDDAAWNR